VPTAIKKLAGALSHHEWKVKELRKNRKLATACATLAVNGLNTAKTRGSSLLLLRTLAEAFRGLNTIARKSGIRPATLRRVLSRNGNPRMKVIEAIVEPLGLRLSVVPEAKTGCKRATKKTARTTRTRARAA
jgi:DNA-binding phage protein